ncbi:MAG: hypothetical protein PHE61_08850 [Candidatus Omnitrophica bacterium]|nr:hypothetical protein [Candidatus Omnitrophota bacterium]
MRKIDEIICDLKNEKKYLGETINNRTMNNIPIGDMPEQYKECERLIEILSAEREGRLAVLNDIPDDARIKILETIERIKNEGSGGLICILL